MMRHPIIIAAIFTFVSSAQATESPSPYQGFETRGVKALSEKDAADLLAGRGAGYALAAELNGYPGPSHVLELADKLKLSARQRASTKAAFDAMQAEAKAIGAEIVAAEQALDRSFTGNGLDKAELAQRSEELGRLYGRYRAAHLKAHLDMKALLSPQQIALYDNLRGYSQNAPSPSPHRSHH
ncbi:MAG: Spy/CpxP family protein refolding chaperone [Alphaproteobacteria bacterium]